LNLLEDIHKRESLLTTPAVREYENADPDDEEQANSDASKSIIDLTKMRLHSPISTARRSPGK
jgi:hypothetical protein